MAKYDVELITDKHGKPMPQYFDEVEKKMKPITKDNFDGTINGSVDVEFPDVQKVEVTNQVDEVSIKELPNMSGTVEVTNLPHIQDVNVTNAIETVSIDNLPSDYPDQAVEARLQAIEQTQSQILNKLNDTIDTRLTGSNVEDALPVEVTGDYLELIDLLNKEEIREESLTGTSILVEANEYRGFNAIWIQNTTDVVLNFRLFYSYLSQYNGQNMYQLKQIDVPSGSLSRFDASDIEGLDTSTFYAYFNFRFKDAAPTSGFVTAKTEAILR